MIREEDIRCGSFENDDDKGSIEGKLRELDAVHREAKHDLASAQFQRTSN